MAKYTTQYGLPQSMVDYLNQGLPSISGIFSNVPTIPVVDEDDQVLEELYPQNVSSSGGGDGYGVYNPDPNMTKTEDNYSPYNYRQAAERNLIGDFYSSGTEAQKLMDMYPDYYTGPKLTGIPGAIAAYAKNSLIGQLLGKLASGIESLLPVNQRAILENEALGAGIALDDIGRIVQGPGDYDSAANVMAGYNLAKITPETIQKRRETIKKTMSKTGYDGNLKERLDALDEFEEKMFGKTGIKTKADIVFNDKSLAKDPTYKTFNQLVSEGLLAGDDDDEDLTYEEIQALKTQFKSPISTGIIPSYPGMGVTTGGGGITNINPTTGDINVGTTTVGNIYDEVALTGGGSKTPDYSNVTTGGPPSVISNPKPKPKPGSSNPKKSGGGGGGGGGGSKSSSKNSSQAGGSFNSLGFSDIRLKENIELIGKSPSNINIYKFNYKDNPTTYQGAMAHEVPWASVKHSNGYMMVDYNLIDIEFKKYNA